MRIPQVSVPLRGLVDETIRKRRQNWKWALMFQSPCGDWLMKHLIEVAEEENKIHVSVPLRGLVDETLCWTCECSPQIMFQSPCGDWLMKRLA